jgi:hypothetical protein
MTAAASAKPAPVVTGNRLQESDRLGRLIGSIANPTFRPKQAPAAPAYLASPEIEHLAQSVVTRYRRWQQRTIAEGIEIGADLIKVKDGLGRGRFHEWLEEHFGEIRTAQRLMQVAVRFAAQHDTVSRLTSPTTVYMLASPSTPEPIIEKVLTQIESGEPVDERSLKKEIQQARAEAQRSKRASMTRKRGRKRGERGQDHQQEEKRCREMASGVAREFVTEFGVPTIKRIIDAIDDYYVLLELRKAVDGGRP